MNSTRPHVLLVDDDHELCRLLTEFLAHEGFEVSSVNDGVEAIRTIGNTSATLDVVVLDIMMPHTSGLDVLREVRRSNQVPIIMLTGRGDDIDRILGLEMGADDYLGKPCNPRELAARIRAVLRRTHNSEVDTRERVSLHGITLNPNTLQVTLEGGTSIEFTSVEFRILQLLMQAAGHTLSKADLTEQALQRKLTAHDRSIDVHISRIRQKLAQEAQRQDIIKSVRGIGYQMVKPANEN